MSRIDSVKSAHSSAVEFHSSLGQPPTKAVSTFFLTAVEGGSSAAASALGGSGATSFGASRNVYELNEKLESTTSSYPPEQVPDEISEILERTPSIEEYQMLHQFIQARDALIVRQKLSRAICAEEDFKGAFESFETVLEHAASFPEWVVQHQYALKQVHVLDLKNCQLSQVPPEIGSLAHLQVLDLENNLLSQLPAEVSCLRELNTLNLTNQLRQFPPVVATLSGLQVLKVAHNWLQQLPFELGNLTQLQYLDASHNQLKQLSPAIGELVELTHLDLTSNKLT